MNALLRFCLLAFTWFYELLYIVLFPIFLLLGKNKGKKFSRRAWDAHDEALNYDPIPDEAEEARKARRKARKPGQLADFDS